jgi:putative flippase GtrA
LVRTANRHVDIDRLGRFVRFGVVGAIGVGVDAAVLALAFELGAAVLVANFLAWLVAVTSNFTGNYVFTYDRPDGSLARLYGSYLWARGGTFCVRAVLVLVLVEMGAAAFPASLAGIAVATVFGFLAVEWIFDGGRDE